MYVFGRGDYMSFTQNEYEQIRLNFGDSCYIPMDIVVVGASGVGKSATINALTGNNFCRIGFGVDPETSEISNYQVNEFFRIWDTPGFGDSPTRDWEYGRELRYLLGTVANGSVFLIDFVLIVLDASSRDLKTIENVLKDVILPNFPANRIIFCMNQADLAMKGKNWDEQHGDANLTLLNYLEKEAISLQHRLSTAVGIEVNKPICISASNDFQINELVDKIIEISREGNRYL